MPTGYEVDTWRNVGRIADALEKIAKACAEDGALGRIADALEATVEKQVDAMLESAREQAQAAVARWESEEYTEAVRAKAIELVERMQEEADEEDRQAEQQENGGPT